MVLAATRAAVPVRVKVPFLHLEFGEQLKVVGENAALGNWCAFVLALSTQEKRVNGLAHTIMHRSGRYSNAAPFLSWTEGDTWIHHSQLPPGTHYFKVAARPSAHQHRPRLLEASGERLLLAAGDCL